MRNIIVASLFFTWIIVAFGQAEELLDAAEEYRLAYEAKKKGDPEAALLHWENLTDSCDMDVGMRYHVVGHIRELRPKVRVDRKKELGNVWTCLVLVYKNIDFEWTDDKGEKQHLVTKMTDQDIEAVRYGMDNFARHVLEYSSRELRISYELRVVERTLKTFVGDKSFWLSAQEMEKDMEDVGDGAYDTVFGHTKFQQEKDGPAIPAAFGGGALGADAGPKGCGYVNIILWVNGLEPKSRDGEIELHEWLHNIDWMFTAVQGYPDEICPTSDWGRMEGDFGGDADFRRTPEMKSWMPYYKHMMMDHVTRRMWRNASMHRVAATPWSRPPVSEWLVLGPFEKTDGRTFSTSFIDEGKIEPLPKKLTEGKKWRVVEVQTRTLNLDKLFLPNENVVAYAHIYVHSDESQRVQLRIGSDDGAAIWHDGRLIYDSEVPRALCLDENTVDVMLAEGWNRFLFKVDEISGGWALSARFTDPAGRALPGVRCSARPDESPAPSAIDEGDKE